MAEEDGLSYRAAGVDLAAAERAKEGIEGLVASTRDSIMASASWSSGRTGARPSEQLPKITVVTP